MKRISLFITIGIILAVVFGGFKYYQSEQEKNKKTIYIAVVGPMGTARGDVMVRGAQLYLDEIKNTFTDIQFQLIEFNDENDPEIAKQKALEIVSDPRNFLIVLGHRASGASTEAGPIYKEHKVPAITASAPSPSVTADNEWYFRVIIENNRQGHFVAEYIKEVLEFDTISVIYQDSEYGRTLGQAVLEQARSSGINIAYEKGYENLATEERYALLPSIADEVLSIPDRGMIVLTLSDGDGAILVKNIRDQNLNQPILEALITQTFDDEFAKLAGSNLNLYLENLWTTQHLIFDTGNIFAQEFKTSYQEKYGNPDATAASYYDAARIAVQAILDSGVDGTDPVNDRNKIRETLSTYTTLNPNLQGATGYLYFDPETRSAIKPVPIGIYDRGLLISAPVQLQTIPNIELVRDLSGEREKGNILSIDGINYYKTQVVYTGIDLIEISNLDVKNSTYTADFYIWFRYSGIFDESNIEFANATDPVTLGKPVAEDEFDGLIYHAYRVKATFKSNFDFKTYPFDTQDLNIIIRNRDLPREQQIFVLDELGLQDKHTLIDKLNENIVGGWTVLDMVIFSDIQRNESTLGNPSLSNASVEYSTFKVETTIQRDAVNFSIKNLFPIFAVLVLAYLAFFIPPSEFGLRVSLGINAIMTTAFFSLKVSSDLPSIGYITALEYIFFMTYSLAIFVIILAIIIFFANKQSNEKLITRLTWAGRIIFPLGIIGTAYYIATLIKAAL